MLVKAKTLLRNYPFLKSVRNLEIKIKYNCYNNKFLFCFCIIETAKKQVIEQIVNRKLIAKNALKNGIEKDPQYVEAMSGIKEDLALQVWQKNEVDKLKFTDQDKKDFFEKNKDKFVMPEILELKKLKDIYPNIFK